MKKKINNLDNKLILFPSEDKEVFQESYDSPDELTNYAYFIHPFKMLIIGNTNSGKTTLIKNLLYVNNFNKIYVVHGLPSTKDYENIDIEGGVREYIPLFESLDTTDKAVLIIEDMALNKLPQDQLLLLNKYIKTYSSHGNLSIIVATQYFYELCPLIRTNADILVIFKQTQSNINNIGYRCNIDINLFKMLMSHFIIDKNDFLVIDKTRPMEHGYRKNLFQLLNPN